MKRCLAAVMLATLCGCANYHVNQRDITTNEGGTSRQITTTISGTAFFSSAQHINKIKATQTDKTQSFGTESVGQQGATNAVEALKELNTMFRTLGL